MTSHGEHGALSRQEQQERIWYASDMQQLSFLRQGQPQQPMGWGGQVFGRQLFPRSPRLHDFPLCTAPVYCVLNTFDPQAIQQQQQEMWSIQLL